MKWLKKYNYFKESLESSQQPKVESDLTKPKSIYSPKNLICEICVSMVLLNNKFLDNILDKGLKARYSENSQVFLTDLKSLLVYLNPSNFRLKKIGKIL